MAPLGNITVHIAGEIIGGEPLRPTSETISLPKRLIERAELVYRVVFAFDHMKPGTYAIAELRDSAATGELVLALFKDKIYVGRWWAKHGTRELVVDEALEPMRGVTILAVINLVVSL